MGYNTAFDPNQLTGAPGLGAGPQSAPQTPQNAPQGPSSVGDMAQAFANSQPQQSTPPPDPGAQVAQQQGPQFAGGLKGALQRFAYYGGQAAMKHVGLPTDEELAYQHTQMAEMQQLTESMRQANAMQPVLGPDGQPTLDSFGRPMMLPGPLAKVISQANIAQGGKIGAAQIGAGAKIAVGAGNNATSQANTAANNATKQNISDNTLDSKERITASQNAVKTTLGQMRAASGAGKLGALGVTSTTRSMSEMATTVLPQMDQIKKRIDSLAQDLGPAVGRWNQLMVNKGGADFPKFAGLDTDLDLLASAIVRTHFGARGGQEYRKELRRQFGEAQSPEDLKARIDAAKVWIQGYADAAKNPVGATSPGQQPKIGDTKTFPNGKTGKWDGRGYVLVGGN